MFELYNIDDSTWQIHGKNSEAFAGNFTNIATVSMVRFKISDKALECAVSEMVQKEKDSAHFDINGNFVYSFNRKDKYPNKY